MVTVAPEMENGLALVEYLKQTGVIVSFGHSGADYQTTQAAIDAGVTHATHLFNAMRGIHHREPGAVTALLLRPEVYTELIADGHHLAPDIVDLSYRLKTADKLILVTDATRAQCLGDGCFELGGQEIFVKDRAVRLKNGTLAGSILTLAQAMQFVLQATRCSMNELVKMVSSNPAKQLQLHDQGHISKGLLANLVVLNERLEIIKVITQPTLGVPQP
jgi:N-acetylglucosamine-6-phosphate deacetylase